MTTTSIADTHRTFQVSGELFWGFRVRIDLFYVDSLAQAIAMVKQELRRFLLSRNLVALVEKVDAIQMHVHEPQQPFQQWLKTTDPGTVIYLCDNRHQ